MVNRRLDPTRMLSLIRKYARKNNLTVEQVPKRGKGSHTTYVLLDADGTEVSGFGLTGHPQDLSLKMMHQIEEKLEPLFGDKWTEKR